MDSQDLRTALEFFSLLFKFFMFALKREFKDLKFLVLLFFAIETFVFSEQKSYFKVLGAQLRHDAYMEASCYLIFCIASLSRIACQKLLASIPKTPLLFLPKIFPTPGYLFHLGLSQCKRIQRYEYPDLKYFRRRVSKPDCLEFGYFMIWTSESRTNTGVINLISQNNVMLLYNKITFFQLLCANSIEPQAKY